MDSFRLHSIENEKSNGILNFISVEPIKSIFRLVLLLLLISGLSTRVPLAIELFIGFFKELTMILVSPCFIFILGNAIIFSLFAISGRYSNQDSDSTTPNPDLYQEFADKSEEKQGILHCRVENRGKQSICEEVRVYNDVHEYRRTQSEKIKDFTCENSVAKFRISETEKGMRIRDSDEKFVKLMCGEDRMSNEEFRDKIEAFIVRQRRIQTDE